jgi:hypothetical protein
MIVKAHSWLLVCSVGSALVCAKRSAAQGPNGAEADGSFLHDVFVLFDWSLNVASVAMRFTEGFMPAIL